MAKMNPKDAAALTRVPLQLLPSVTTIYGAMAIRQGAIDYGPYNWRDDPISLMKYIGAIKRHAERLQDGEWLDAKSGQPHLGHIIATSGIILDAYYCGTLIDDRPKVPGHATDILDFLEKEMKLNAENDTSGQTELPLNGPGYSQPAPAEGGWDDQDPRTWKQLPDTSGRWSSPPKDGWRVPGRRGGQDESTWVDADADVTPGSPKAAEKAGIETSVE